MSKLEEREARASNAKRKSFVQAISETPVEVEGLEKEKIIPEMTERKEIMVPHGRKQKKVVTRTVKETGEDEPMKQYSYYMTTKLQKAIIIKTAEGDLDKSGVVREALRQYLADILAKME